VNTLLTEVDAWVTVLLLAAAMIASWLIAWWRGRSFSKEEGETPAGKFNDAILALLGLLLAFTFSMSLVKHEQRRQMVVTDSNAIGDFYTTASLLKEPVRGKLQGVVRRYVEHRLSLRQYLEDEAAFERKLDEIQESHRQMQSLVEEAVNGATPVVVPLVNTLNAVTSSHAARLAAVRDRLPPSIVLLLFLAAVLSMALIGRRQGASKGNRPGATIGFTALICMIVWVTLDLNQPQQGWITVSQEPLQRLLKGMEK
jgi:hypothetical protein